MVLGEDVLFEGECKEVIILFFDICGYIIIIENLEVFEVVKFLN